MNNRIIEIFTKLLDYNKIQNETFKVRAYKNAINEIKSLDFEITSSKDVKVGKKLEAKIDEIITTNDLEELKEIEVFSEKIKITKTLMCIYGIGEQKAIDLYDNHNIRSLKDLEDNQELLNDKQKIGLKYYDHLLKKIPRKEMDKHNEYFKKLEYDYMITGSYRRGLSKSGDIDVLIVRQEGVTIENILKKLGDYVIESLAEGGKKFMGICKLPKHKAFRRVDILLVSPEDYYFSMLYFTGSMNFNIKVRKQALERGYSINEYGFTDMKTKKKISTIFTSEKEILEFIGLKYVEPENRI